MKIYITGLPSGYEVEHLVRLFYPMAPLTLTPPEEGEDCVWAEKKEDSLYAMVREQGQSRDAAAPLPRPVEAGGETVEFTLASLTYDLLRSWTGIRPPWGKMTGVRPVRLIHDKRAAGWTKADIDRFFLERFDCSRQKYDMAKAIADLQEPILKLGSAPKTYSLYLGIPFCPSRCSYCSFVSCNLDRDRKLVQPYVDCLCREVEAIREQADKAGLKLCSIYIGGGPPPPPPPPIGIAAAPAHGDGAGLLRPFHHRGIHGGSRTPRLHRRRKAGRHQGIRRDPHLHQSADLLGRGAGGHWPQALGAGYPGLLCRCPEGGP